MATIKKIIVPVNGSKAEVDFTKIDSEIESIKTELSKLKSDIKNICMPDYSNGIEVSSSTLLSGFTSPSNGILVLSLYGNGNYEINGQNIGNIDYNTYHSVNPIPFVLAKNDVFKINCANLSLNSCNFYSYKGAN